MKIQGGYQPEGCGKRPSPPKTGSGVMGKRSEFERKEKDFYPTPIQGVLPLLKFLRHGTKFIEPCCGKGDLVKHLEHFGVQCVYCSDLYNTTVSSGVSVDAQYTLYDTVDADYFITNPPWTREILHPIIINLAKQLPTWLLIDADWAHTKQAAPYMQLCSKIVSIGRLKWIPDSKYSGKDNCAWYLFDEFSTYKEPTIFYGREK